MQKILGMCAIHYGGEYLDAAIRQAEPYCDKIIMLYTDKPSYGHGTNVGCPESESDLMNIAYSASPKVEWRKIDANGEGQHRGLIFRIAEQGGYDGVLTFDADEIFDDLSEWIPKFVESKARNIGFTGYVNFWKSFNYACFDSFAPIRYINIHNKYGQENFPVPVYHFGCAQRMEIMRYKLLIHGHKAEIRNNWLTEVYERWQPGMIIENGLHLVAHNLWPQAAYFDKTKLPEILKSHFNYPKDVIL
jgi:hypothetical protein